MAATDPKVGRFTLAAAAALKSNDPLGAFAWLAEAETDPDLKFGFEHAAEMLRARRAADTT
ncbi:hypothetical protein [Streptacidiphilus melanogenes]|uniref:hypothetical protein n=1 Tax=Streptacidiphilus melanogenes TaxID=411235 RepID=UPI00126A032A|nr:hypothetical protein [Streptacidiphilus melanogenes]